MIKSRNFLKKTELVNYGKKVLIISTSLRGESNSDILAKSYSSIHTIRGVLRPAFQMAVADDILVKNPFGFQLAGVLVNDAVTREQLQKTR